MQSGQGNRASVQAADEDSGLPPVLEPNPYRPPIRSQPHPQPRYSKLPNGNWKPNRPWRPSALAGSSRPRIFIVMRGASGSGKSTLAKSIVEEFLESNPKATAKVLSTDDYFIQQNGEYLFDRDLLRTAHEWNANRVDKALQDQINLIIVDNTHSRKWEAVRPVRSAARHRYKIQFREPTTPWARDPEELAKRSQHGVPKEQIQMMLDRWESDFTFESIMSSSRHGGKAPRKGNEECKSYSGAWPTKEGELNSAAPIGVSSSTRSWQRGPRHDMSDQVETLPLGNKEDNPEE